MTAFNNVITRSGSGGTNLVPVEYANTILQTVTAQSAALQSFSHVPMSRYQERVPVLSMLPQASWVNGEGGTSFSGLKSTTSLAWEGRTLQAEEIACIVPVPDQLLADSEFPIWDQITPFIAAELGRQLDNAVFFGVGAPASFPTAIVPQAIATGATYTQGTNSAANGGLAADVADLFGLVENQGFVIDGVVANTTLRQAARNARSTIGLEFPEINVNDWYGTNVQYALKGLWPTQGYSATLTATLTSGSANAVVSSTAGLVPGQAITGTGIPTNTYILSITDSTHLVLSQNASASESSETIHVYAPTAVVGDFSNAILGIRSDIEVTQTNVGVINDASGNIIFNMFQQDMTALRVVARFAFQVANYVTYQAPTEASRWPFAVLQS